MCLITKSSKIRVAREDIVCYRILIRDKNGFWKTPFMNIPINPANGYKQTASGASKLKHIHGEDGVSDLIGYSTNRELFETYAAINGNVYYAEDGFVHSYASLMCSRSLEAIYLGEMPDACIWKCIIPKGANYTTGITMRGDSSYASDCLVYQDEISPDVLRELFVNVRRCR